MKKRKICTICYGRERLWDSREEAMDFFWEGVIECDGSERERYLNVYEDLKAGKMICTDGM